MTHSGEPYTPQDPAHSDREVILRRMNRWQAEAQREDFADFYVECRAVESGQEFQHRADFLGRFVDAARSPGFDLLVAETDTLVGAAFGFPVSREGSWWQHFDGVLPPYVEQLTASGHVFAITDLLVHPYVRDRGVAGQLQKRLLDDNQASLGAVRVSRSDRAGYAAYQSWGWQEIGGYAATPTEPGGRVLVLPIGERSVDTPGGLVHNVHTQRPAVS